MSQVTTEVLIPADPAAVYAIAKDIEKFPEFMPSVESVRIVESDGGRRVSEWVGRVEQFNRIIKWTEEDLWDDSQRKCTFCASDGDWDKYEGVWTFEPEEAGTRVVLSLEFDLNVPLIGPLIKGVIARLVKHNCEEMLEGLRQRASAL